MRIPLATPRTSGCCILGPKGAGMRKAWQRLCCRPNSPVR
uniref:Uncharacterized protein n=1 Tax=Caudovirales sp. ctXjW8 TaxID=2826779 RepID=A0A8S5N5I6_9CAUD|nr:MAG TPA: hypothetical protein [Caudovirales sp. ctXjW8]